MNGHVLLAIDPSLRGTGWVAFDIDSGEPVAGGALETRASFGENDWSIERVLDDARCCVQVARGVVRLLKRFDASAVALEAPAGAKDARAAAALPRANQAITDAVAFGAPHLFESRRMFFVSAHGAKWAATGSKVPKGGKAEVRDAVIKRFGRDRMADLAKGAKSSVGIEGVYDAAAVGMLAMRLPGVRALRTEVGELAGTVQLSNKACRHYYTNTQCGCPDGRCWYDEQLARRARVEPALTPDAWLRTIQASAQADGGEST